LRLGPGRICRFDDARYTPTHYAWRTYIETANPTWIGNILIGMIPIAVRRQQCKDLIRSTSRSFETKHHQELHATRKRPLETVLPPKTMVAVDLGFPKRSRRVGDRSKVSNLPPRTRVIWDDSQTTAKCWMCEKHELFLERFLQSSYTSQLPYPAKLLPRAKVVI